MRNHTRRCAQTYVQILLHAMLSLSFAKNALIRNVTSERQGKLAKRAIDALKADGYEGDALAAKIAADEKNKKKEYDERHKQNAAKSRAKKLEERQKIMEGTDEKAKDDLLAKEEALRLRKNELSKKHKTK